MKLFTRFGLWLMLVGSPVLVCAQTGLTSLRGTVTDSSGAVLAGADVSLENAATGFHASDATDQNGAYEFPQIPPGKYTISVGKANFGKQLKSAELLVSQPATINFSLSVKAIEETVDVSGVAQTVNTSDATIGNAVSNSTIQALPMEGRNVPDLLSLQPGVVYLGRSIDQDQDSRSGAVAGARSDQGNITLDGVDNNDQRQGYAFTGVLRSTLDSVEEFRVTTTNSNADSGRSSGAQVTLVTKSGTNIFHGSVTSTTATTSGTPTTGSTRPLRFPPIFRTSPASSSEIPLGRPLAAPSRMTSCSSFSITKAKKHARTCNKVSPSRPHRSRRETFSMSTRTATPTPSPPPMSPRWTPTAPRRVLGGMAKTRMLWRH